MNFLTIEYLREGTEKQRTVYALLKHHQIIGKLQSFDAVLSGTIPLNIDVEDSDLDILCHWKNKDEFIRVLENAFSGYDHFQITQKQFRGRDTVIARFRVDGFAVEVFGQSRPVEEQEAYRHMLVEYKLLQESGESFRLQVIALKRAGVKTEPAFAKLLGLVGDPYEALLDGGSGIQGF